MHTLEAALCTGLTLLTVAALLGAGPVSYDIARDAATAGAYASYARLDRDGLYVLHDIHIGSCTLSAVSAVPDKMADRIAAASEAIKPLARWIEGFLDHALLPEGGT
jgi:hypothetical protein